MSIETINVDLLKKRRSAFKGQLTYFSNESKKASTLGNFESILRRVRSVYDKYDCVQLELETEDNTFAPDRALFESDYGALESVLLDKIRELSKLDEAASSISFTNSASLESKVEQAGSISIRLPELQLPLFTGSESEWLSFRDTFSDLIHSKNIEPTVKFAYLNSCIRSGKAYTLIEHLPVSGENYAVAWQTICDRYNNEAAIQRFHMKQLYDIQTPLENSSQSLQAFIDTLTKHYCALRSLKIAVHEWDLILTHHITQRLDIHSRFAVIKQSNLTKISTFDEVIQILISRVRLLQALSMDAGHQTSRHSKPSKRVPSNNFKPRSLVTHVITCKYCSGDHILARCPSFNSKLVTPKMRFQFISDRHLCVNCLEESHKVRDCSSQPCNICSLKHHTSLHFKSVQAGVNSKADTFAKANNSIVTERHKSPNGESSFTSKSATVATTSDIPVSLSSSTVVNGSKFVMIGTSLVNAKSSSGNTVICRALLDSGSQMNFITNQACSLLKAKKLPTSKSISGIGGAESLIRHKIYLQIASRVSNYAVELKCYVIPRITNHLPSVKVSFSREEIPIDIQLADPYFNVPDRIDLLIGAEIYNELFVGDVITPVKELPPFYNTVLGYVVCGKGETNQKKTREQSHVALCSFQQLEAQLKQFWELENVSVENNYSSEEAACEQHFRDSTTRQPSGRYTVSLPLNSKINKLGSSSATARRQFLTLEQRFRNKPEIRQQYIEFMREYQVLGHMSPAEEFSAMQTYYLPHHYVLKEQSSTTKLRVVFNASSNTSSRISLNDCLMVGPTIQQDLLSILLRFRTHIVGFCADIAKMYRQIQMTEEHRDLQRIWWRENPTDELRVYKLCTVTYGTASAPFLATRTLKQLSIDEGDRYAASSRILARDFYVDDVLSGAATVEASVKLKNELVELLSSGGFDLRKFHSNEPELASDTQSSSSITLLLGLSWNTQTDHFETYLDKFPVTSYCSKRNMLSEICQLFDPLGICAPIILKAKLYMQELWTLQTVQWDDPLPEAIATKWINFKAELSTLRLVELPRLIVVPKIKRIELHGFSDASESAYGCVVYTRTIDHESRCQISLVCAKSRVAPLKRQSIPRLELCAALLLAEVVRKVEQSLEISFDAVYLWSDSEITLYRIKSEPSKYTTFVANRITKIQEYTSSSTWYYVRSCSNPADCVSRGLMPSEFMAMQLYWNGPHYLKLPENEWPQSSNKQLSPELDDPDTRKTSMLVTNSKETYDQSLFHRFSSYKTLVHVTAYILRFFNNAKSKLNRQLESSIILRISEIDRARNHLIKLVQSHEFPDDIKMLQTNHPLPSKSSLRSLSPFLDSAGLLRVGGRIDNASTSFDHRHPILLPGYHILCKLITKHEHVRLLHAGPQTLLYNLRQTFWITNGRNLCRTVVNQCVQCFHTRPHIINQVMGNLPVDRVTSSVRAFVTVGIDFCGPFVIKPTVKSKLQYKCYICLFICFATKAVHLEVVMNCSTESFIACLRRFCARRGLCKKIYSDNATNFIGARTELRELHYLMQSQLFQQETHRYCTTHNIEWNTIPPRSPHFGGLWESAIKSAKHHLRRVIGTATFTSEEFHTLTVQVEACLNSRPISPMSNDPSDLIALSPGHFLIGAPLTSLADPSVLDLNMNRLSRFQLIQHNLQTFWTRWRREYLTELQHRHKWQTGNHSIHIGALVLLHDDNLPPTKWCMGRIMNIHPGKDHIARVVTVKTIHGDVKRAINRVSLLPSVSDS